MSISLHERPKMFFCCCFVSFFRIKNLFIENKKEAGERLGKSMKQLKKEDYLYQYADIKLNILMDYNAMSMIVEVQFLLKFMQDTKRAVHTLYEVTRNGDFIQGNDYTVPLTCLLFVFFVLVVVFLLLLLLLLRHIHRHVQYY